MNNVEKDLQSALLHSKEGNDAKCIEKLIIVIRELSKKIDDIQTVPVEDEYCECYIMTDSLTGTHEVTCSCDCYFQSKSVDYCPGCGKKLKERD
jgi:hypothetical protein